MMVDARVVAEVRAQRGSLIAWRANLRRAGWLPPLLSGAGVIVLMLIATVRGQPEHIALAVAAVVAPAIAIQAALSFTPGEEPALELLLATPRPFHWIVLERYAFVFGMHGSVALIGVGVSLAAGSDSDVLTAMARWLPAAIFMAGLSIFITLRSRAAAMGMVVIILLWFVTLFGREVVLPVEMGGQPFLPALRPLQPVLWLAHPYLDPTSVTTAEYAANRATLIGLGCALIWLSVRRLRDTEWILSGVRTRDDRKQEG